MQEALRPVNVRACRFLCYFPTQVCGALSEFLYAVLQHEDKHRFKCVHLFRPYEDVKTKKNNFLTLSSFNIACRGEGGSTLELFRRCLELPRAFYVGLRGIFSGLGSFRFVQACKTIVFCSLVLHSNCYLFRHSNPLRTLLYVQYIGARHLLVLLSLVYS